MKRKFLPFVLSCFVLLVSGKTAHARALDFLFLYPGGQGSQEQAQPILDEFSAELETASGGKIEGKIHYFNDVGSGEIFIRNHKPAGGILSEDIFMTKAKEWGAEKLLSTLQLPSGDGTNQYFILGPGNNPFPPAGPVEVYSSRPIPQTFLMEKLFPGFPGGMKSQFTPHVVGLLRKMGKKETKGWVLLDQYEAASILKSKAPWAQDLQIQARSEKVSSAPWVIFPQNITPETARALKAALLKLSGNPANRQTLEMLRVKGFR